MNLVMLDDVSKQLAERVLFENLNLRINRGDRIGLIGVNGSGKTTLLRMIVGLEPPDDGSIGVASGTRIQYLPQEPELDDSRTVLEHVLASDDPALRLLSEYRRVSSELEERPDEADLQKDLLSLSSEMDRLDAWAAEARARRILSRLGVKDFDSPVGKLSGGQRKRVALARALIEPADLLVLDEPTNHVDADTIAWLEEHLISEPGALIMVTHDRYFLDRVVNRIVELDRRELQSYPGSYTSYMRERTERHERLGAAEVRRRKVLKRELEWLRRAPKARTTKQKARSDRIEELRRIAYDRGEDRVTMALADRRLGKKVLEVEGLHKSYDDLTLFRGIDLVLEPGERIGIIGPNGSGKTTFLDILAGSTEPDLGSVVWGETVHLGYFDQEGKTLDERQRVIAFIEDEAPLITTKDGERVSAFRMLEWFLFDSQAQHSLIGSLSGGERRRLQLLWTLIGRPNVLFLDEPTNDLDIQTLSVLEDFLDHFAGSLVVASHDRYFLDRTVDQLVFFEEGRFGTRFPTPFSVYLRLRQEQEEREGRAARGPATDRRSSSRAREAKVVSVKTETRHGLSWKEERELEGVEQRVSELESKRDELSGGVEQAGGDYLKLEALSADLGEIERELEKQLERWIELSEKRDGA